MRAHAAAAAALVAIAGCASKPTPEPAPELRIDRANAYYAAMTLVDVARTTYLGRAEVTQMLNRWMRAQAKILAPGGVESAALPRGVPPEQFPVFCSGGTCTFGKDQGHIAGRIVLTGDDLLLELVQSAGNTDSYWVSSTTASLRVSATEITGTVESHGSSTGYITDRWWHEVHYQLARDQSCLSGAIDVSLQFDSEPLGVEGEDLDRTNFDIAGTAELDGCEQPPSLPI